jgi:hypothetical protein
MSVKSNSLPAFTKTPYSVRKCGGEKRIHSSRLVLRPKLLGTPPRVDIVAALDFRLGANGSDNVSTGACDLLVLTIDEWREFERYESNLVGGGGWS